MSNIFEKKATAHALDAEFLMRDLKENGKFYSDERHATRSQHVLALVALATFYADRSREAREAEALI